MQIPLPLQMHVWYILQLVLSQFCKWYHLCTCISRRASVNSISPGGPLSLMILASSLHLFVVFFWHKQARMGYSQLLWLQNSSSKFCKRWLFHQTVLHNLACAAKQQHNLFSACTGN